MTFRLRLRHAGKDTPTTVTRVASLTAPTRGPSVTGEHPVQPGPSVPISG